MQLALAAGILDVDYLLNNISSVQFSEWQAFHKLHPFGPQAETQRFAIQQANIANSPHFTTRKIRQPSEFMPSFKVKQQTAEEQIAILKGLR